MPGGYRVYTPSSPRDRLTRSATVEAGKDYVIVAPGANLITQTVGSFPSVSGVTSESGAGGANDYSLQLNTNFNLSTSACSGGRRHVGCGSNSFTCRAPCSSSTG